MAEIDKLISSLYDFKLRSDSKKKLVDLGADEVGERLLEVLSEGLPENVRWVVVDIFASWKWQGAVDYLVGMLEDYPTLHLDILRALKEITGLELEADKALWEKTLKQPGIFVELQKGFKSEEIIEFSIHEEYCSVVLPLPNSRRQQVLIIHKGESLNVYTECGEIQKEQIKLVEDFNEKLTWAQLVVETGDTLKVTLTAEITQDNISAESLKYSVKKLAELADSLEEQLTGKDKI
ncbi:MAG: hypothetical protein MK132_24290 [Lentisphaerales bacterium]|nr:hypothetical protein [Lentisphaerales bacterium]